MKNDPTCVENFDCGITNKSDLGGGCSSSSSTSSIQVINSMQMNLISSNAPAIPETAKTTNNGGDACHGREIATITTATVMPVITTPPPHPRHLLQLGVSLSSPNLLNSSVTLTISSDSSESDVSIPIYKRLNFAK